MRKGKLQQALLRYQEWVAANPSDLTSLNRVGDLLVHTSRIDEAVGIFLRVAARYSKDGFLAKAMAIYRKVLRFDPLQKEARDQLTDLYRQRGLPVPLFGDV